MADSAGLDIRLLRRASQTDADTTLAAGSAHAGLTDMARAIQLCASPRRAAAFMAVDEPLSMVAMKGKRVKRLLQMREKMIALTRLSALDYWCDRMMDSARMDTDQIYRPQINDVRLRADMVRAGLMEGAMTGEPYATWLAALRHRRLYRTPKDAPRLFVWVMADSLREDTLRLRQVRLFGKVYADAVRRINRGEARDTVRAILRQEYGLPAAAADTLRLPLIGDPEPPDEAALEETARWLRRRGRLPKTYDKERLIVRPDAVAPR